MQFFDSKKLCLTARLIQLSFTNILGQREYICTAMIHVVITNLIVSTLKVPFIHSLHSKFVQT